MKVSGFCFVKNAVSFGYPVTEAIRSVLPVVDEFIILLGDSDDETTALIEKIGSPKIKTFHSVWDKSLREGGKVLAAETDKAMEKVSADSDWLFYIQADEVVHEMYHDTIRQAMQKYSGDKKTEGLLFNYRHFYGSYKYLADGRSWYTKEIRIIRNDRNIRSYRDAQGFRWADNRKLNVRQIPAFINHYGWVRNPVAMTRKQDNFSTLYDPNAGAPRKEKLMFDYSNIDSLLLFKGTHPIVMKELLSKENWDFEKNVNEKNFRSLKHRVLYFLAQKFGWRPFAYKNYKKI